MRSDQTVVWARLRRQRIPASPNPNITMVVGSGTISNVSSRAFWLRLGSETKKPTPVMELELRLLPITDPKMRLVPGVSVRLLQAEALVVKVNDFETSAAFPALENVAAVYVEAFVNAVLEAYQLPPLCTISRTWMAVSLFPCFQVIVVGLMEAKVVVAANIWLAVFGFCANKKELPSVEGFPATLAIITVSTLPLFGAAVAFAPR